MDESTPFGRFGNLSRAPRAESSWWLNLSREAFVHAAQIEAARMNQQRLMTTGQNRVVGTHHGKI